MKKETIKMESIEDE